ncbi:MAG: hypothetical protein ACU4F9_09920 [Arcticibacter sp.]
MVIYSYEGEKSIVLQESELLPVYSPCCDQLKPLLFHVKGNPHILFEISDGHQDSWHEHFWLVSANQQNFGSVVWEEKVYTQSLVEGEMDKDGVFPVMEMEAKVEFDTSKCSDGIWIMNTSKIMTQSLSNASEGTPSSESQQTVNSFKPIVKKLLEKKVFKMRRDGRFVKV